MNHSTSRFLLAALTLGTGNLRSADFSSDFGNVHDRVWAGEDYWANPMEDWRIKDGRLVCVRGETDRNVHLLTFGLDEDKPGGAFSMSVRLGLEEGSPKNGSPGPVRMDRFAWDLFAWDRCA